MVRSPHYSGKLPLSWVFCALVCWADASLADDFITLPTEFAARVPARLVFSQAELIQCWQDPTARRCVLKGDMELTEDVWRQGFRATGGTAPVRNFPDRFTVTSDPCTARGVCLPGEHNEAYTMDFNSMSYAMSVERNAIFVLTSVQLFDLAPATAYTYSSSTPWKSTGGGTTTWPTIGLAPNATLALVNSSVLYLNPSDTDDCVVYTQKRNFAFRQLWGESNVTALNTTANVVVGPTIRKATIRNGSTDDIVGNAYIYYRNVTFICMDNATQPSQSGLSPSILAVAVAVPVGVALLAGCLVAVCCLKRRRRLNQQPQHDLGPIGKVAAASPAAAYVHADIETGQAGYDDVHMNNGRDQVTFVEQKKDVASATEVLAPAAAMHDASNHSTDAVRGADTGQPEWLTPASTTHNSQALQRCSGSGGTYDVSTFSTAAGSQRFGTSYSSSTAGMDERLSSVSALLKARSDMSMLRDLKVGPLLGRGSYGRVYKGRWKATPVAVKIIEHHAAAGSSGGKAMSAGRETLLATSVSHPNVVTTYHISTMSMTERSALASSWLEGGGGGPSSSQQEQQDSRLDANDDSEGSTISSLDESPPDLVETWIIMEFCEKGSLERAVRLGKFKLVEGQGQMVGIYKALLDTASGLDYLHSIGVVHGDLKTANVLLKGSTRDARGVTCKITDFGLSRVLDPEATHISTGTYGTIVYMPKELLLSGRMTQATDIYSFGLMMWEMFTSQPVMDTDLTVGQMFYMIAYEDWRPDVPPDCPAPFAELMCACWHEDPEQRPTAQQLLRRLQKLYVQEKQQYLAARGGQHPARSSSSRSRRRAAAAASTQHTEGTLPKPSPFPSGGSGGSGGLVGSPPAADGNSSGSHAVFGLPVEQQGQGATTARTSMRSSAESDSAGVPSPPTVAVLPLVHGRRSTEGTSNERTGSYQPYAQAVMQRSTSVSSAVLVPAHVIPCLPSQADQLAQLQQQLAQTQDAAVQQQPLQGTAAQQQLPSSYAMFTPPMLPVTVLPSQSVSGPCMISTQQAVLQDYNEDDMFDEDGLASDSFLRHLTNPSNALYGNADFGGVEFEDQFSGYLHPPAPADRAQQAPAQSMQQTVEQYRQQLQLLQEQAMQRHQ